MTKKREIKQRKRCMVAKNRNIFKKSISVENREFIKFINNNGPVIEGFKKLTSEFGSTLNTHAGVDNAATNNNTFITMQNNENEEDDKKMISRPKLKVDNTCVQENLGEDNFHHFPKEVDFKKPNVAIQRQKGESGFKKSTLVPGNRRKRMVKAKSLQIILDEGIIQSSATLNYFLV